MKKPRKRKHLDTTPLSRPSKVTKEVNFQNEELKNEAILAQHDERKVKKKPASSLKHKVFDAECEKPEEAATEACEAGGDLWASTVSSDDCIDYINMQQMDNSKSSEVLFPAQPTGSLSSSDKGHLTSDAMHQEKQVINVSYQHVQMKRSVSATESGEGVEPYPKRIRKSKKATCKKNSTNNSQSSGSSDGPQPDLEMNSESKVQGEGKEAKERSQPVPQEEDSGSEMPKCMKDLDRDFRQLNKRFKIRMPIVMRGDREVTEEVTEDTEQEVTDLERNTKTWLLGLIYLIFLALGNYYLSK